MRRIQKPGKTRRAQGGDEDELKKAMRTSEWTLRTRQTTVVKQPQAASRCLLIFARNWISLER